MDGRVLLGDDMAALEVQAAEADVGGAGAVLVGDGPLGDAVVLAAGLSALVRRALLGVRTSLAGGRHPAMLARELTTLDLICGGRSVLCIVPSGESAEQLAEALGLCRDLWRGRRVEGGAYFPVAGVVSRPRPATDESPLLALDLSVGRQLDRALLGKVDLLFRPTGDQAVRRMERT